ncbi:MAG: hypothetical protein EBY39_03170 [Flavobacteriia bacterium]|nr:hypothetical protein [Flavobacteriia bacterium]
MKTGKITHIDPSGQWNGLTKYKVTFADGNQYTFFAKNEFKFNVGETITYEVTNEEYRNAKIPKDQYKGSGGVSNETPKANYSTTNKDTLIIRQTCIKASAEFNAQRSSDIASVIEDAEIMYKWITQ